MDGMSLADRAWPVTRRLMAVHTALYRATGGRVGRRGPRFAPCLLLDHVGAKSGKVRTSPLIYGVDGENLVVIASKGGYPKNPAWYHNLMTNPDATVQVDSEQRAVHARVATPEERERLWPLMVGVYRDYDTYQRRAEREIPVVVLEPR
jgi:deazaflavin-dependent oxidoreductase (nitroreductase family)